MVSSLVFFVLFSIALCAPPKKVEFTVDSYFVGSWMISNVMLPANGGEIEEKAEKYLFNVTKTADDIMAISYIDIPTNTIVEEMSMVASLPTNMSLALKHSAEQEEMMTLHFHPISAKDVFAAYTVNPHNAEEFVEISTINHNRFLIKVISKDFQKVTLLTCDRVVVTPQPTFFQKYGQLIMMAIMMLVQMFTMRNVQPQETPANGEETQASENQEGEATATATAAATADKPKSE